MTYAREIKPTRATRMDMVRCLMTSPAGAVFRDVQDRIWVRIAGGQYVFSEPKGTLLMLDAKSLENTHGPIRVVRQKETAK
jgi:hypothetical protein